MSKHTTSPQSIVVVPAVAVSINVVFIGTLVFGFAFIDVPCTDEGSMIAALMGFFLQRKKKEECKRKKKHAARLD